MRRESGVFGRVPAGATHWSIRKRGELSWEWCTWADGDGVARHEFPLEEMAVALVKKRWGAGTYRVMFVSLVRGTRQVFGNGKVFELTEGGERSATPRPTGLQKGHAGKALPFGADDPTMGTEQHSEMVQALLKAGQGKHSASDLFESLAVPTGIGLSSLFSFQERTTERLDAIERRLASLEARLGTAPVQAPAPQPQPSRGAEPWKAILDKLDSIEDRIGRVGPARRPSPSGRRASPPPR